MDDTSGLILNKLLLSICFVHSKSQLYLFILQVRYFFLTVSCLCFCPTRYWTSVGSWCYYIFTDLKMNWELKISFLHLLPSAAWDSSVGFFATQVIIKQQVSLILKPRWLCMIYSFMFLKSASVFLFTGLWKSSETHCDVFIRFFSN